MAIVIKKPVKKFVKPAPASSGEAKPAPAKAVVSRPFGGRGPFGAAPVKPSPRPVSMGKPAPAKPAPAKAPSDLDLALKHAAEAEKTKDYFISTVGRDMSKPIEDIGEIARWLREGTDDAEAYVQALDSLIRCSDQLKQMLSDMMSIARLNPNNQDSGREATDVAELVADAVDDFRGQAQAKGVSMTSHVARLPILEVDAHRLRQVLRILLSNAVMFTAEGRIGVEASYFGERLRLMVEDTGCGMPVDAQERFASDAGVEDIPGDTTMALSMAKRLVLSMGGEITLRSTPGIGTVFTVTFPRVYAVQGGAGMNLSSMQRIRTMSLKLGPTVPRTTRVLVVDDSPVNLAVMNGILKAIGFTDVDTAADGADALGKILTGMYGVVFADMRMPVMDGPTLIREIRKIPVYAELPVYAVTIDDSAREAQDDLGFTGMILKPVTKEKLQSVLG